MEATLPALRMDLVDLVRGVSVPWFHGAKRRHFLPGMCVKPGRRHANPSLDLFSKNNPGRRNRPVVTNPASGPKTHNGFPIMLDCRSLVP